WVGLGLGVVDVRQGVIGLGVVGLQLNRLLVGRLGLVVVLLLRLGEGDVVVAVVAVRVQLGRVLERRDRRIVVAGATRRDAFLERLLQLGVLRRRLRRRAACAGADDEDDRRAAADRHARRHPRRDHLVLLRGHAIVAGRQAD